MQNVYLLFGVPCSGKSWVISHLPRTCYRYVSHDASSSRTSLVRTCAMEAAGDRPVIVDCPFDERNLRFDLENAGLSVIPVCVLAPAPVVNRRYMARNGVPAPANVLTRATTIHQKVDEWVCYAGESDEILNFFQAMAEGRDLEGETA